MHWHPPTARKTTMTLGALLLSMSVHAHEALIAVAANFAPVAAELETTFESTGEHAITLASGSTGKLYAQIVNSAPYDAFLAADQIHPRRLLENGRGMEGSCFTYALGQMGIWIPGTDESADHVRHLESLNRIAIANPALAPYGVAAMSILDRLELTAQLKGRLVMGENVAQAYAMVASGAAQGGVLAWSYIVTGGNEAESFPVPPRWHPPVRQAALLLRHGRENPAARAFLRYLQSESARSIIRQRGYLVP